MLSNTSSAGLGFIRYCHFQFVFAACSLAEYPHHCLLCQRVARYSWSHLSWSRWLAHKITHTQRVLKTSVLASDICPLILTKSDS